MSATRMRSCAGCGRVYDHAPMHLRSSVLRRLHALSRRLGVNYVHGEPDAAD